MYGEKCTQDQSISEHPCKCFADGLVKVLNIKKSYLEVFMARPRGKLKFFADSFINWQQTFSKQCWCYWPTSGTGNLITRCSIVHMLPGLENSLSLNESECVCVLIISVFYYYYFFKSIPIVSLLMLVLIMQWNNIFKKDKNESELNSPCIKIRQSKHLNVTFHASHFSWTLALKCYSLILCGGSAENIRFWLFCVDLVANW